MIFTKNVYYASVVLVITLIIIFLFYNYSPDILISENFTLMHNGQKVVHLLWTGGYDSTYRLMDLLVVEKVPVQPVYVMAPDTDDYGIYQGRQSIKQELITMGKIRKKLCEKYPHVRGLFLNTIFVYKVKYDREIEQCMRNLAKQGSFSREHSQYGAFAMISKHYKLNLEECAEKGPDTILGKLVSNYVVPDDKMIYYGRLLPNWCLSDMAPRDVQIFRYLRFPVINLTKYDMLFKAKENGYDDFLRYTTSCWYPRRDGSPCRVCRPCVEKIEF